MCHFAFAMKAHATPTMRSFHRHYRPTTDGMRRRSERIVHLLLSFAFVCWSYGAEWVEIAQRPKPGDGHHIRSTSSIKLVSNGHAVAMHHDGTASTTTTTTSTPSPHWVRYQRERYRNQSAQALIVSTGQHLKNSAQIVVPARVIVSTPTPSVATATSTSAAAKKKNKFFRARTRLNVVAKRWRVKPPHNTPVETTSKREMSNVQEHQIYADDDAGDDNDDDDANDDDDVDGEMIEVEDIADEEPTNGENAETANTDMVPMPSINGFFKFLKSIKSSWWKKTGLSFDNKIQMLKQLRDNLMRAIEKQLSIIWLAEKSEAHHVRHRRGLLDESNLNFPPEAALMSINFLTFAVFLIKLVLQVVHIVKSKHYSFSGFNVNTEPTT